MLVGPIVETSSLGRGCGIVADFNLLISKVGENYKVKMAKLQSELQNKPLQGSST